MRILAVLAVGLLAASAGCEVAFAQAKKPAAAPAGEAVRYLQLGGELLGELSYDATLRETRQGGKVVSAVLDVCYSVSTSSDRKDRFVVNLKPDGAKLTGTGQSQEDKVPVTVSLTRKPAGKSFNFEGTITRGSAATQVASNDNTDMSETEFRESEPTDDPIEAEPADFTSVGPGSIAIKVKRDGFVALVKGLRDQNVKVPVDSLVADCVALRTGEMLVRADLDPERAGDLVAKLKAAPGVSAVGFSSSTYTMDSAIRVPAAAWRGGDGKLDKTKLASDIGALAVKTFGGKLDSTAWDATTGELTIKLKRPSTSVVGLDLAETLEIVALVGPEKPKSNEALIVWVASPSVETVDDAQGAKLQLTQPSSSEEESSTTIDSSELIAAIAQDFKGKLWDLDKSAWK